MVKSQPKASSTSSDELETRMTNRMGRLLGRFRWHGNWLLGLSLVAATILAYHPVWQAGFIWDDDAHLTRRELQSLNGLARIWTEPGVTQQYYPLVHTVFWIEQKLWRTAPLPYHLGNVLLHGIA